MRLIKSLCLIINIMVICIIISESNTTAAASYMTTAIVQCAYPLRGYCFEFYKDNTETINTNIDDKLENFVVNKRKFNCINLLNDCGNGEMIGAGTDDKYLSGSGTPGKRYNPKRQWINKYYPIERKCINIGDDGCANGEIPGSGRDGDFLFGNGTPGK